MSFEPVLDEKKKDLISAVFPVLNEEMNLHPFYEAVRAVADESSRFDWEFIFVDDGSTDRSVDVLLSLREKDARIKVLKLSRNFGSHSALTAGLTYASGDAAVIMSVDLQDPPEIIRDFLREWKKGSHVIWGIRISRGDPWSKKLFANLFYKFCRRVALDNYPEGGVDCSMFDRRVVDIFLKIKQRNGFLFATVMWMGFRQAYVPYERGIRAGGVSKWSFAKRFKSAVDFIVSFSYFPVRFISYLGICVSLLSFLYAIDVVFERVFFGKGMAGWPSVMVTILFLSGMQLIMMGVLGEYIWRGTDQVKGLPQFIVMDEVGFKRQEEQPCQKELK